MIFMKKKKIILSIAFVLLLVIIVFGCTYAFFVNRTGERSITNTSGKTDIVYSITENITGVHLTPSDAASGGLNSVAVARLNTNSVPTAFNIYITPTSIDGLNVAALKWEVIGTNNDEVVYSNNGDFSTASNDTPITIVNKYELKSTDTTFNIYIWLDASLIDTSLDNSRFAAKISADTVQITGNY